MSSSSETFRSSFPEQVSGSLGRAVVQPLEIPPPPINYYWGSIALAGLSAILFGILAFLAWAGGSETGALGMLGVFGLLFGVPAVVLFAKRARMRCTIATYEQGVSVSRKGLLTSVPFRDVEALFVKEKIRLNNGVAAGLERRVEMKGRFGSASVTHFARQHDLTLPFTRALLEGCAKAMLAKAGNGGRMTGEGWSLSSRGLESSAGQVALSMIDHCAEVDGRIQFWRDGQSDPFLSVPSASKNAMVLLRMASDQMKATPDKPRESAKGPGRLLFQRRHSLAGAIIALIISLGLLATGIGVLAESHDSENSIISVCFIVFGIGLALISAWAFSGRKRFYENGLSVSSIFGSRTLLYPEVARFSWSATRQYVNGAYAGTSIKAKLAPESGRSISLGFSVSGEDEALDMVRQQIAFAVSERMFAAVKRGERVPWGTSATFLRDALEHRLPKLVGKGEMRRTPYKSGLTFQIERGELSMFSPGNPKAIFKILCSAENFWPGLIVLERMTQE